MSYLYSFDSEEMLKNANVVKDIVLGALEREKLLTKSAAEIGEKYAIVLHQRGWFGRFWNKWFEGTKEDALQVHFVKIV